MEIEKVQYTISEYAMLIGTYRQKVREYIEEGYLETVQGRNGSIYVRVK